LDAGKVIASDKVDQSGQFVLLPPGLSSGDHLLTLRITPDGGQPVSSDQSVAVAVRPGTSPVVTLAEPGKPSVVLASPSSTGATDAPPVAAAAPSPTAQAQIRTAEVEAGGRFYATGNAAPGSTVRLYLNGSHVADASTAADGKWSLKISKGVNAGKYTLRADVVGENDKVISRAEVPFEAPVAVAAAVPRAPAPVQPPAPPVSANPNTGLPGQSALASGPTPTSPAPTGEQAQPAVAASPSASAQAQPMPANPSASAGPPAGTVVAANGPTSNPIVPEISTATVSHGDSLWRISRVRWGAGKRYTVIYEANAAQIRNPDLIYPGQVLVMPH
jgi:nucleoid-associated protein YgaU